MWIAIGNAIGSRQPVGGGAPPDPGYTPPLDAYPATAAYSVRKLSSTYSGPCMEVCRVSDGATQDIGFDSDGFLQTSDIVTFSGGGEVRVRTWYDQTGNLRHATNATSTLTELPKIYTGSAFISGIDGNACVQFIRTDATSLSNPNFDTYTNGWLCITASGSTGSVGDQYYIDNFGGLADRTGTWFRRPGGVLTTLQATSGGGGGVSVQYASGTDYLWVSEHTGSNLSLYTNGLSRGSAAVVSQNDTEQGFDIGRRYGLTQGYADAISSEIIFYNSNQSSNRQGLESNLNDYFQIANLPASSSGLLYDYPDASAAYSVRQLSNNAIKCVRVRQTVPPYAEQDIGFTATGDLDEQAIIDFGGANPLTVSKWYDQSGQSNHATQGTPGNQPQIYNGTAVITENGKPAIDFTNIHFFSVPSSQWTDGDMMSSIVLRRRSGNDTYWTSGGAVFRLFYESINHAFIHYGTTPNSTAKGSAPASGQLLTTSRFGGGSADLYENGSSVASTPTVTGSMSTASDTAFIGQRSNGGNRFDGPMQELIHWGSDQTSNRTAIEYNVGDYYGIDVLPLDTYTTANAAYSFRKLRTAYAGSAIRVRRDVAPFDEQDIGFDSYGNLDIAALDTFSGGDRLRASAWYDQTANGFDASNVTYAKQPLIHDGTSVVTLNGSPAMDYEEDVTSRNLITANGVISATASPLWIFVVGGINAGFTTSYPKIAGPAVPMGVVGTTTNFFSVWRGTQVFWGPGNGAPAGDQYIRTETATGTAMNGYLNGVLLANNKTIGTGNFTTNLQFGGGGGYAHKIQEYIIFEDNMTADRVSIENMINSHYGTY